MASFLRNWWVATILCGSLLGIFISQASFATNSTLEVTDLSTLSNQAKQHELPILLLMSSRSCHFCDELKSEVLHPMLLSGFYDDKVIVREFYLDNRSTIIDFNGETNLPKAISKRYETHTTPTMLFVDHSGTQIAERIVGLGNIDYARHYIEEAIADATASLQKQAN